MGHNSLKTAHYCGKKYTPKAPAVSPVSKAKAYNTYIAPQAAYRSFSGAVHVTDRAEIQP